MTGVHDVVFSAALRRLQEKVGGVSPGRALLNAVRQAKDQFAGIRKGL